MSQLNQLRSPDGASLSSQMKSALKRQWELLQQVESQLSQIEQEELERLDEDGLDAEKIKLLMSLRSVGEVTAVGLVRVFFCVSSPWPLSLCRLCAAFGAFVCRQLPDRTKMLLLSAASFLFSAGSSWQPGRQDCRPFQR